jgi:hypothetical protein
MWVESSTFNDKAVIKVRKGRISSGLLALLLVPLMAGCSHKLVAHNGETTVSVYTNKEQFDKLQSLKSQGSDGGLGGIVSGIGESMLTRRIDNDTPVKVLLTDDEGAMIEVTDGPEKGLEGYVAKDNLD